MGTRESSSQVPVPGWSKKSKSRCLEEKTVSLYCITSSPRQHSSAPGETSSSLQTFPQGNMRVSEHPTAPALRGAAQEATSVSPPPELRECVWLKLAWDTGTQTSPTGSALWAALWTPGGVGGEKVKV